MGDKPRQDWKAYQTLTAEADAALSRELTLADRFALCEDMFRIAQNARQGPGDWDLLDRLNWEQKLATRKLMVDAFRKLDELRAERTAADNSG